MAVTNNNQNNPVPVTVNPVPQADPELLVFSPPEESLIFPDIEPDLVDPSANYHGGNPPVAAEDVQFFDCDVVQITNNTKEVVSDFRSKGIVERTPTEQYLWDEIFTTPLGLYEEKPVPQSIGLYDFQMTTSNEMKLHTEDVAIIPKIGDYLVVQRFFDNSNTFANESTTDDLNHVPAFNRSETFQLKITDVVPATGDVVEITNVDLSGSSATDQIKVFTSGSPDLTTILQDGDKVNIGGVQGIPDANGTFIVDQLTSSSFELLGEDGTTPIVGAGTYTGSGEIRVLPLFTLTFDKSFAPIASSQIDITDVTNGSPIVVTTDEPHKLSTGNKVKIDGVGGVSEANGTFFITVTSSTTFELDGTVGSGTYTPSTGTVELAPAKYMLVLLNRKGENLDVELFEDTWQQVEIHRQQLIGDPFEETSVLKLRGRKNYLNYSGHEFLGMQNLLEGVIENKETPFVVFDLDDDIKDRLDSEEESIQVHLPTVMLQGEENKVVLKNQGPILTDEAGAGNYSGLFFVDAANPAIREIRYGWVMHELRIIVVDHPELATALGYNSNRNYTLPKPTIEDENLVQNPTETNPIAITDVTDTTPIVITTGASHGFNEGDTVTITGVQLASGSTANANGTFTVQNPTATTFEIVDTNTGSPIVGNGTYSTGGEVVGNKPPFEYFITYRINGIHYNTLPFADPINFNFDVNDEATITVPKITHLVDSNNFQGFEANAFEVIVGKHKTDLNDPTKTTGVEYISVVPATEFNAATLGSPVTISDATNTSPIEITTNGNHGFETGERIMIEGVEGNTAANGIFTITKTGSTTFELDGSSGNGAYVAGGTARGEITKLDLKNGSGEQNPQQHTAVINKTFIEDQDEERIAQEYNLVDEPIYDVPSLPSTLFTGDGIWTLGFIKYKQQVRQYRLTAKVIVPADRWNGTTNPSLEPGNSLMKNKLISEIGFLIVDADTAQGQPVGNVDADVNQAPFVYGKISPPLEKNNSTDLSIEISVDF